MQTKTKTKRWTSRRHNFIILLAYLVLYPWTKLKTHVKVTKCKELRRRQCLVVMNHQTIFDQFFVSFALFPRHVYFISSDEHFKLGFISKLLQWAVAPIPIKKQLTDPKAVMNCIRVAREGGTIALAPEGNRTFSGLPCRINPAIASLVKKLNLPLAIFRIEGGYGIQPRWSAVCRKGKMKAYVSRIIEPEEYQSLSKEALHALIQKELYVDETQNPGPFRHKKAAEGLEQVVYVCPNCGLSQFEGKNDIITCKNCGLQARYLPDQHLEGVGCDFPFPYVAQWYQYQENYVNHLDTNAYIETPLYRDTARFSIMLPGQNLELIEEHTPVSLYGNRIQAGQLTLFFSDLTVVTVQGKNKLNMYHKDAFYQLWFDNKGNAIKYMNIFHRHHNQLTGNDSGFLGM